MGKASSTTVAEMARPASLSQYQHRSVRQYQEGVQLARGIARHHALWIDYELIGFNRCVERIILQTVPHLRTTNMKIEGFTFIVLKTYSPSQVAARCGSHGVWPLTSSFNALFCALVGRVCSFICPISNGMWTGSFTRGLSATNGGRRRYATCHSRGRTSTAGTGTHAWWRG